MRWTAWILAGWLVVSCAVAASPPRPVVVEPVELPTALRNPLKGLRGSPWRFNPWTTLIKFYIPWNKLEDRESDTPQKIRDACNRIFKARGPDKKLHPIEQLNIKAIPRVYLDFATGKLYWPSDMTPGDYSSPQFIARVRRLVARLGEVWDHDPRIAYVEMGLIGKWGEHHHPSVSPQMQKILGDAFTAAFHHKSVMVRLPWDFTGYRFGIYWDSWDHAQQARHAAGIEKLQHWPFAPIGGETAFNWGRVDIQPGRNPDEALSEPVHLRSILDSVRRLHGNHLGWISEYTQSNPAAAAGAEQLQRTLGYRFVIRSFTYPQRVEPGGELAVRFSVVNTGSSPLYVNWPVELSLLDPGTHRPIWRGKFTGTDTRTWQPGDQWQPTTQRYAVEPTAVEVSGSFALPRDLAPGRYIVALSINDPACDLPSVRFAIRNYFRGGRHPMGYIGVGVDPGDSALATTSFDDPAKDFSLHYETSPTP